MAAILMPFVAGETECDENADKHVWKPDTGPRLSASLLARLSEAADGHRTSTEIWLVGQLEPEFLPAGHKIHGPYKDKCQAFTVNEKLFDPEPTKDKFKIFGPFLTREPIGKKENQIKRVILVTNDERQICLDGTKYDCVFWSLSAYDKFVVPYYVQMGNLVEAEEVRNHFRLNDSTVAGTHIPGSEIIGALTSMDADCPEKAQRPKEEDIVGLNLLKVPPSGVEEPPILLPI